MRIVADEHVDPEFGTGAVKITPAHDPNDFEIGKRHNLEFISIFTEDGKIKNGGDFDGQKRFDARYTVLQALKDKGLYVETKDNPMQLPLCSRTKDIIEPVLKPQWWMDVKDMAKEALTAVEDGRIKIRPETANASYRRWMSNIQPWCLSRQLWWGHQIPAYKVASESGEEIGWIVARSSEEADKKAKEKYSGQNVSLTRDEDVLDSKFIAYPQPDDQMC
jgi:valyl-tRNA synthetase